MDESYWHRNQPGMHQATGRFCRLLLALIAMGSLLLGSQSSTHAQDDERLQNVLQIAAAGVESNAEWQEQYPDGFEYTFEDGVVMVLVPAGCFQMGGDPRAFFWTGQQWKQGVPDGGQVCFSTPFWIDKYEVTQEQFSQLAGKAKLNIYFEGADRPRENVTWFEARDFCTQRGDQVRLPTEAEWEYAARGVDSFLYPWGNDWVAENVISHRGYDQATAEVGSAPDGASWVGAMDMSGNMWEWLLTLYLQYPYPTNQDGTPADAAWFDLDNRTSERGMRGGSWNNSYPDELRSAYRQWGYPDYPNLAISFRCVRLDTP